MKISIIVAVYNVEEHIDKCLSSLATQDMCDVEFLIVDDCGTDKSMEIARQYAMRDSRFRIIEGTQNEGVASARNRGMRAAQGEYLIHIDPDDWIEQKMLSDLYYCATQHNADVVICDYYETSIDGISHYRTQRPSGLNHNVVLRELFTRLYGSCWNKLVRKSCLLRHNVQFDQSIVCSEDFLFWVELFRYSDVKIAYWPHAYYHYIRRPTSITYDRSIDRMNSCRVLSKLTQLLPGKSYEQIIRKCRMETFLSLYHSHMLSHKQAWLFLLRNCRSAFLRPPSRSLAVYLCILLGLFSLARKLMDLPRLQLFRKSVNIKKPTN